MKYDFNKLENSINNKRLRFIGNGSGRIVYDLGDENIVKVAKNIKGIAQNDAEYRISSEAEQNIFAKVIDVSEDFKYLIMQKAEPVRNMSFVRSHFNVRNLREFQKLSVIRDTLLKHKLKAGDFVRPSSWGMVNGVPVVVDYGLTDEVFNKYYFKDKLEIISLLFLGM